ncbi:hypothetical protein TIFTF001_005646 [Ficus carica]|uniref:PITH domain-containing protein n=1 Tax=Ficus carica TaxID=3494 RepID=A0AA87ZM56_FICCA|nr:hypothetical protein TIFTF001_005646 [Ficus carica]
MACLHDHSCEDHDCSSDWSLYKHIDLPKVSALNEAVTGSAKSVFKAWEHRLNSSGEHLESNDGDPELLVFIPFTSDVKIKGISIVGGTDGTSPSKMRAFINRDGIDFSDAQSMQAVQEWELVENFQGVLEFQTKYSKFQSVGNITLHFPENFGADTTKIYYIGFKGEATQLKRDVVATIVYELMPNPSDHKTRAEGSGEFDLSFGSPISFRSLVSLKLSLSSLSAPPPVQPKPSTRTPAAARRCAAASETVARSSFSSVLAHSLDAMTKKNKSKTSPKIVQEETIAEEGKKPSTKKLGSEIDEIFAGKKRKKTESEKTEKVKKKKKYSSKVREDDDGGFGDSSSKPRKKTADGLTIYTDEELGINNSEAGGTPLCPFDCSCCY